jgi:DNA modification methylase
VNLLNAVNSIPKGKISHDSIDIVITSPLYGDSHTTVAYGQYSRLSSEWLGILKHNVDSMAMGGATLQNGLIFDCGELDSALDDVRKVNLKRSLEVYSYYSDLYTSIRKVSKVIKSGGYACYVVANRKVAGISLPTDKAIECFFEKNGFTTFQTFARNIPNKRMPSKNSPSNIVGKTEETMSKEYIIIMRK